MTSIVGVLNKRAAVIAADSVVTITRGDTGTVNLRVNDADDGKMIKVASCDTQHFSSTSQHAGFIHW